MTLPTGSLSMSQVATELGLALPLSLQHAWVRALAQASGASCDFNSLRGKTGRFDGNLTTSNRGTSPPTVIITPNAPFFGGTIASVFGNTGGGCSLSFSSNPVDWTGNIQVKNNTLNQSAIFSYQSGSTWTTATNEGFLDSAGASDSYTILPSN